MNHLDRRNHLRHRISALTYVSLDNSAGGILLDISQGGMGVQLVGSFRRTQAVHFSVQLTGTAHRLSGTGEVAWANPGGRTGIKMLELSRESSHKLKEWLFTSALAGSEGLGDETPSMLVDRPRSSRTVTAAAPQSRSTAPAASTAVSPKLVRRPAPQPGKAGVLQGPFPLTARSIEANVSTDAKGVYVLGEGTGRDFEVLKVSRTDDLKDSLGEYLGRYKNFQYSLAGSQIDAWDRECELYHQHRPRDNKAHPVRRYGSDWDCPVCHGFA
jgi:hypothetical protein